MATTDEYGKNIQKEVARKNVRVHWGTTTVIGVLAGLIYGGSREAVGSASKDAEVMLKLGSTADKREQYRVMRDAMEKRFIRVARSSILGGAKLGLFTAAFCGVQQFLEEQRGIHDAFNVAGAGSATAAVFGLLLPGSLLWRARNVLMGSVLGAAICLPLVGIYSQFCCHYGQLHLSAADFCWLGWVQITLVENVKEGIPSVPPNLEETDVVKKSGVAASIDRLEKGFNK